MPPTRVRPPLHRTSPAGPDDGFAVIEALVSFVLLAVVSAASVTAIVTSTSSFASTTNRSAAANLAQQDQNAAQALRYPRYPTAIGVRTVPVSGTNYTVTRTVNGSCPLPPNYDTNPYLTVTTTVTWLPASPTHRVVMAQEFAC